MGGSWGSPSIWKKLEQKNNTYFFTANSKRNYFSWSSLPGFGFQAELQIMAGMKNGNQPAPQNLFVNAPQMQTTRSLFSFKLRKNQVRRMILFRRV